MREIVCRPISVDVVTQLREPCLSDAGVRIWWLGQAGFCISGAGLNVLIDPYLSDYLARKYRGQEFDHVRMMSAPLHPGQVRAVDYVLCTHRHGDHMDPDTLPVLMEVCPRCRLIGPAAEREAVHAIVSDLQRVAFVNDGDVVVLSSGNQVEVLASAHERLMRNERGEHHFLGYILQLGGLRIYHSGDCVPYPGLTESLRQCGIHVALLPVNGRDPYRASRGVPGNFALDEAIGVLDGAAIPWMICHHFGMFQFNTVPESWLEERIRTLNLNDRVLVPEAGIGYAIHRKG